MRGPSTFEDLAAVIAVCLGTARVDGDFAEEEFKAILDGLRAQYNFEGRDDLLAEYIKSANEMDLEVAIRRIQNFDSDEKQFTSDMLFMTIASDGKLDPQEEEVYKNMIEVCDLPLFTGADQL
ncbi:MAG: TerB family tellurite resistance protein [Bacteroidales bacterium]|nr:TerB family tellurite resistance protein [Bacteroidales bacterium]